MVLHLNKLESLSPKDALCQNLVEIGPVILEKIFLISSMQVCYFVIISP